MGGLGHPFTKYQQDIPVGTIFNRFPPRKLGKMNPFWLLFFKFRLKPLTSFNKGNLQYSYSRFRWSASISRFQSSALSFAAMPVTEIESPMMEAATKEAMRKLKQGMGCLGWVGWVGWLGGLVGLGCVGLCKIPRWKEVNFVWSQEEMLIGWVGWV